MPTPTIPISRETLQAAIDVLNGIDYPLNPSHHVQGVMNALHAALASPSEPSDAELLQLAHAHKYQGPPEADLRILEMLRAARNWESDK